MILNLKALEYDAAYVEMGQQYLKKLQELEKEDIVKKEHCISFMDVDLYSSGQIVYANRQGYDYIIKDYGNIRDPDFEQISFLSPLAMAEWIEIYRCAATLQFTAVSASDGGVD